MTEQYIEAMSDILDNSRAVILPNGKLGGSSSDALSPRTIASAITLYKELLGNKSIRAAISSSDSPDLLDQLQSRLDSLEYKKEAVMGKKDTVVPQERYQYLDDKALFSD